MKPPKGKGGDILTGSREHRTSLRGCSTARGVCGCPFAVYGHPHGPGVDGPQEKARSRFYRKKIRLGQKVLNTMTELGRPVFERIS